MRRLALAASLLIGTTLSAPADAAYFELRDLTNTVVLTFSVPDSPTPIGSGPLQGFALANVSANGGADTITNLNFYNSLLSGGFDTAGLSPDFVLAGPQLYSGNEDAPTFIASEPGNPYLMFLYDEQTEAPGDRFGTLTVTLDNAIPEPLTLGLFGLGLAGLALARRRRG